jgi:hypothetical protein
MTTGSDREVILERVRRLFALSNDGGATQGEAATAAAMAARLMARYQLGEGELRVERDGAGGVRIDVTERDVSVAAWRSGTRRMPTWHGSVASVAARATGCRAYREATSIVFVGAFRDAAVAVELQTWLVDRCDADTRTYMRFARRTMSGFGRTTASSFRFGWVNGVSRAVEHEVAERESDHAEMRSDGGPAGTGTDLVVVTLREVAAAKSAAVDSWMQSNIRLRSRTVTQTVHDSDAYGAGHSRGRSIRVGTGANLR